MDAPARRASRTRIQTVKVPFLEGCERQPTRSANVTADPQIGASRSGRCRPTTRATATEGDQSMSYDEHTSADPGLARRGILRGVGVSAIAASTAGLAACSGKKAPSSSAGVGAFPRTPKWKFVFVNHVTTNPFFQATQYGIQDACDLLGVTYQWTGSESSKVSEMVNAMNTAITSGAGYCVID